jgi:hypothetical protein
MSGVLGREIKERRDMDVLSEVNTSSFTTA